MLKPSANIIDCPHSSRYSLVVAVAKRAREISQEAEDSGEILIQKPVELAVKDFINHRCSIVEPDPSEYENDEEENEAVSSKEASLIAEAEDGASVQNAEEIKDDAEAADDTAADEQEE